jgi:hypothetical protein
MWLQGRLLRLYFQIERRCAAVPITTLTRCRNDAEPLPPFPLHRFAAQMLGAIDQLAFASPSRERCEGIMAAVAATKA